jgi:hypothetical protein
VIAAGASLRVFMSMSYNPAFRTPFARPLDFQESTTMPPRPRPFSPGRLLLLALVAVAVAFAAAPAQAGTIYVPLPGVTNVGTATWDAELTIANASSTPLTLSGLLLPQDTDGTQRAGLTPAVLDVGAAQTLLVRPGGSFAGLAELAGSPYARYAARLTGKSSVGQMGVELPVVTSSNAAPAGGGLSLQGLSVSATRATTLVLVNLGQQASQCTTTLLNASGAAIGTPTTSSLKPLSQLDLANVFNGAGALADARAYVSCTRSFFAYALTTDSSTGEIAVVQPAGSGESSLTRPGEEPACPTGATCLASSLLFQPTPTNPIGHVIFPAPAGSFTRARLSIDVTIGQWYPADPDGKHLVYWWVINRNLDMLGMLYFRGPEASTTMARWGIALKHELKKKAVQPFVGIPGHTYRVVNDVDMGGGVFSVTVTDLATNAVVTILDTPNVAKITLKTTDRLLIDVGFKEGAVPDEVPSFNGWTYTNVRMQLIP